MERKTAYKFGISVVLILVVAVLVAIQRVPWEAGLGFLVLIGAGWQVVKRTALKNYINSILGR